MKLYHHPLSGHAHRAHLFLSLAGVPHDLVEVDLAARAHKAPDFLALNPFGQVPVLVDGDVVVPDSIAIMVYAARKFGKRDWFPEDPVEAAAVQRWLSVSTGEIYNGPCAARLVTLFGYDLDPALAIKRAHAILGQMEAHLAGRDWIATGRPTAADAALYSYVSAAPEGNVDLAPYPAVRAWLARVEGLPGFVPFRKSAVGLSA
ncbi:glutathione S-transferase family protein [Methylobacterium symbioticum]|uniref:Glutathione S-transferase GST-4.5 n=1 Tax=Methylobacterium symbioticum TaxID=2584084 RepID=A0A509EB15_9HYPH|nr:glutathione S-transferase [Methylobacterium symbioticum]VUD71342.1 Glutathione S-transferase GST-4.5 [Methylobacterium symbioticum]